MGLGGGDDLNNNRAASIIRCHSCGSSLGDVNLREVRADLVALNRGSIGIGCLHQVFRSRASVLCVVLNTKVLLRSTRVVTCSEDEGTKCLLPYWSSFTDSGRDSRGGEQSILTDPETLHTVGNTHLDDCLDSLVVVVTAISSNNKSAL